MWNFIVESILRCDGTRIAADFSTMSQNEWFASVEMHERASRARRPIGRLPLRSCALAILHEFMASKRPDASTLWRQIAFQRFFTLHPSRPLLYPQILPVYCDSFTFYLIIFRRLTIVCLTRARLAWLKLSAFSSPTFSRFEYFSSQIISSTIFPVCFYFYHFSSDRRYSKILKKKKKIELGVYIFFLNFLRWQLVARTITSDQTVYNNSVDFFLNSSVWCH